MNDKRASIEREAADEPPRKRRRAKVACAPCRERKRKCDGRVPCNTCTAFEYECYPVDGRRGRKQQQQRSPQSVMLDTSPTSSSGFGKMAGGANFISDGHANEKPRPPATRAHLQSLEANSGAAFVRTLGLKIDPQNAPRLRMFGWNTGDRLAGYPLGQVRPITALMSREAMAKLAEIFMRKVAVVYGVIQADVLFDKIGRRWAVTSNSTVVDQVDQVLCGVAAMALLFSEPNPPAFEPDLVESARSLLEQNSLLSPPPIDTVTGWVLRVAYLRMTSKPHVTWLGSCTLMHVVEAARIHQEAPSHTVFEETSETVNVEIRRRLYGMALHLNIWVSFDLGRTQVALPNVTTKPLTLIPGDFTSQLLSLIPLTESLDPNRPRSLEDLESDLSELLALDPIEEPPAAMAHVNLTLCIFRRLRAQRPVSNYVDKLLELARRGLQAARDMVDRYTPWHHVANIPFQIVCFLLSIDNRASLAMLTEALSTLKRVRDCWNTPHMQEAYDTAYLLVLLHQRRKEEDAKELRGILDMHLVPGPTLLTGGQTQTAAGDVPPGPMDMDESLWLDNLFTTIPALKEFDMDQFLIDDLDFGDLRLPLV